MSGIRSAIKKAADEQTRATLAGASSIVASVDYVGRSIDSMHDTLGDAHSAIGEVNQTLGEIAELLMLLSMAVQPEIAEIRYQARIQSESLRNILEAIQNPADVRAKEFRRRAEVACANGWLDDAEREYEQAIEQDPYDFSLYQALGSIAFRQGKDLHKARANFERSAKYAMPRSPQDAAEALLCAAAVAESQSNFVDAEAFAVAAKDLQPSSPGPRYAVAKYQARIGMPWEDIERPLWEALCLSPPIALIAEQDPALADFKHQVMDLLEQLNKRLEQEVRMGLAVLSASVVQIGDSLGKLQVWSGRNWSDDDCKEIQRAAEELAGQGSILDRYDARKMLSAMVPSTIRQASQAFDQLRAKAAYANVMADGTDIAEAGQFQVRNWRWTLGLGAVGAIALANNYPVLFVVAAIVGPFLDSRTQSQPTRRHSLKDDVAILLDLAEGLARRAEWLGSHDSWLILPIGDPPKKGIEQ